MRDEKVVCDNCGRDLAYTDNAYAYRVLLTDEEIPRSERARRSGIVTDMHLPPAFDRDHHFCDRDCLSAWVQKSPLSSSGNEP